MVVFPKDRGARKPCRTQRGWQTCESSFLETAGRRNTSAHGHGLTGGRRSVDDPGTDRLAAGSQEARRPTVTADDLKALGGLTRYDRITGKLWERMME